MFENAFGVLIAVYLLWILSIGLSVYLMWTGRAVAYSMIAFVLWGSNGVALLFVLYAIAKAAGAL